MRLHPHIWIELTGKNAYGTWTGPWGSKFWGKYHGQKEEACAICGLLRLMQSHDAWESAVRDKRRELQNLLESEPK